MELEEFNKKVKEMETCTYCAEEYTRTNKIVECFSCHVKCCAECMKSQLVSNMKFQDYCCPNCKATYSREFLLDSLGSAFVNGTLVSFKKELLFSVHEQDLMFLVRIKKLTDELHKTATQGFTYILRNTVLLPHYNYDESRFVRKTINNLDFLDRRFKNLFRNEFIDLSNNKVQRYLANYQDFDLEATEKLLEIVNNAKAEFVNKLGDFYQEKVPGLQKKLEPDLKAWVEKYENRITVTATTVQRTGATYTTTSSSQRKEVTHVNYPCSSSACCGSLKFSKEIEIDTPEGFPCDTCGIKHCNRCFQLFGDSSHECKEEDMKFSMEFKRNSVNCPKCNVCIQRSSGCAHMFCTLCATKFNWATGEIYTTNTGYSNPLYTEYIMKKGIPSSSSTNSSENNEIWDGICQVFIRSKYTLCAEIGTMLYSLIPHVSNVVFDGCNNFQLSTKFYNSKAVYSYISDKMKKEQLMVNVHKNYKVYEKDRDMAFLLYDFVLQMKHELTALDVELQERERQYLTECLTESTMLKFTKNAILSFFEFTKKMNAVNKLYGHTTNKFAIKHIKNPVPYMIEGFVVLMVSCEVIHGKFLIKIEDMLKMKRKNDSYYHRDFVSNQTVKPLLSSDRDDVIKFYRPMFEKVLGVTSFT